MYYTNHADAIAAATVKARETGETYMVIYESYQSPAGRHGRYAVYVYQGGMWSGRVDFVSPSGDIEYGAEY